MHMYLTLERTANGQLNSECACVHLLCAVIIRLRSNKWESNDNCRNQAKHVLENWFTGIVIAS